MVELILYLEPTKSSPLWNYVQDVTSNYTTTASKYACHVTMTGFFSSSHPDAICQAFHDTIKRFPSLDAPIVSKPLLVHETDLLKAHLLLPVSVTVVHVWRGRSEYQTQKDQSHQSSVLG
jgi:hypothetical protein